jgi:hypothetical protein
VLSKSDLNDQQTSLWLSVTQKRSIVTLATDLQSQRDQGRRPGRGHGVVGKLVAEQKINFRLHPKKYIFCCFDKLFLLKRQYPVSQNEVMFVKYVFFLFEF